MVSCTDKYQGNHLANVAVGKSYMNWRRASATGYNYIDGSSSLLSIFPLLEIDESNKTLQVGNVGGTPRILCIAPPLTVAGVDSTLFRI